MQIPLPHLAAPVRFAAVDDVARPPAHPGAAAPSAVARPDLPAVWRDRLLTLGFVLLFLVQLVHHNPWRDELNPWGIVLAHQHLPALFSTARYDAHPWLWYILLWLASHVTSSPLLGLKVVEGLVGTAILCLIGLASPFSTLEKLLLFCSYFFSFEYVVPARMYSLVVLMLLLYLRDRTRSPAFTPVKALLLGLMCCADLVGLLLSLALLAELWFSSPAARPMRKAVASWAIYLLLLASAVASGSPHADVSTLNQGRPLEHARSLTHLLGATIRSVVVPWLPVRPIGSGFFWNPAGEHPRLLLAAMIPLVLLAYWMLFRRHRSLLALMGVALLVSIAFGHLLVRGSIRHFGLTFLAFVAALWILRLGRPKLPRLAVAMLALSAFAGLLAAVGQWRRPFSNAEPTAAWLRTEHLDRQPMAGTVDTSVAAVAELLHRPMYFLDCSCSDTFLLYSTRRDHYTPEQLPERLQQAAHTFGNTSFLFLDTDPLEPQQQAAIEHEGLGTTLLQSFTGAENIDENFFIYRVSPSPTQASLQVRALSLAGDERP